MTGNANRKGWIDRVHDRLNESMPMVVTVSLVVALFSAYVAWVSLNHKELSLNYLSDSALVANIDKQSSLKVIYEGVKVRKPRLMALEFSNTGNVPVLAKDIEGSLQLIFKDATLIEARVSKTIPEEIDSSVAIDGRKLIVSHGFLNPRESIFIELVYDGDQETPKVSFRIAGASSPVVSSDIREDVVKSAKGSPKMFWLMLFSVTLVTLAVVMASLAIIFRRDETDRSYSKALNRINEFDESSVSIDPRMLSEKACLGLLMSNTSINLSNYQSIEWLVERLWSEEIENNVKLVKSEFTKLLKEDVANVALKAIADYLVPTTYTEFDSRFKSMIPLGDINLDRDIREYAELLRSAAFQAEDQCGSRSAEIFGGIMLGVIAVGLIFASWVLWSL